MKLTELQPRFLRYIREANGRIVHRHVDTLAEAQGIWFLCPKCTQANGGKRPSVHGVICWSRSRGIPDQATPGPGRWRMNGTGFADLTLNADPPSSQRSVKLTGGCGWHGHVTRGDVT